MKFLCVPCDKPMDLENKAADRGSVSLIYACPDCGYEFAMLTNPMETQLVSSLGVSIGKDGSPGESKCPFTGMVQEAAAQESAAGSPSWTDEARQRMANVPEFVKPMVQNGIEKYAREKGYERIDEKVLDEVKGAFGME